MSTEYMRQYRQTAEGKAGLDRQKRREKARRRALIRLAGLYPSQWERLFREELTKIEEEHP